MPQMKCQPSWMQQIPGRRREPASRSGIRHDALADSAVTGALFTDDVRCPVHLTDLAAALLELAAAPYEGVHHVADADAVSRHELGSAG
jgi:hypothetical protein